MSKNWSKVVLVSLVVMLIGASLASATTTRVRSLAMTGDYINDDSSVHRWYSTLPSFANQVNAEAGSQFDESLALSWTFGTEDYGTFRISLNQSDLGSSALWAGSPFYGNQTPANAFYNFLSNSFYYYEYYYYYSAPAAGGPDPTILIHTPVNQFDLGWGKEFGDAFSAGVSLTYSGWKYEESASNGATPPVLELEQDLKASMLTIGVGGSWSNNDDMVADASFTFGKTTWEGTSETFSSPNPANMTDVKDDNNAAFEIAARAMWDWTDAITLVPVFSWSKSDYAINLSTVNEPGGTVTAEQFGVGYESKDLTLGVGANVDVNTSNMLVFAVEFNRSTVDYMESYASVVGGALTASTTDEVNDESNTLPMVRLALETEITSWLTTRVGATKAKVKSKEELVSTDAVAGTSETTDKFEWTPGAYTNIDGSTSPFSDAFGWYLGAGFTAAEWTIDMQLDTYTPFSMGYWLTGHTVYGTGSSPVLRISAVYNY